jgi:hypothetical protein
MSGKYDEIVSDQTVQGLLEVSKAFARKTTTWNLLMRLVYKQKSDEAAFASMEAMNNQNLLVSEAIIADLLAQARKCGPVILPEKYVSYLERKYGK